MANFKCNNCGKEFIGADDSSVVFCVHCGERQEIGAENDTVSLFGFSSANTDDYIYSSSAAVTNTDTLLKRAAVYLEAKNWQKADEYFTRVTELDPENIYGYLGKLMAQVKVTSRKNLMNATRPFDTTNNYKTLMRIADEELAAELKGYVIHIKERLETQNLESTYLKASEILSNAMYEKDYTAAVELFRSIPGYKDSEQKALLCDQKIAKIRRRKAELEQQRRIEAEQKRLEKIKLEKEKKINKIVIWSVVGVLAALGIYIVITII